MQLIFVTLEIYKPSETLRRTRCQASVTVASCVNVHTFYCNVLPYKLHCLIECPVPRMGAVNCASR